jgi:Na+/H+-dicarboxylate symporter
MPKKTLSKITYEITKPIKKIEQLNHKTFDEINHFATNVGTVLHDKSEKITILLKHKLWLQVLVALFLGLFTGILLGPDLGLINKDLSTIITSWIALPGNIFLQMVKMIIIPLIFSSIALGIISSGNPNFLKKIGPKIILFFLLTTIIAVIIGLGVTEIISPGKYLDVEQFDLEDFEISSKLDSSKSIQQRIVEIIPSNPLQSMVNGDLLSVILFTVIFGIALLFVNKKRKIQAIDLLHTLQDISMRVVKWAMYLVPIAVFGLIAQVTSQVGLDVLKGLGMYVITVIIGLIILIIFYNLLVLLYVKLNPFIFMSKIKNALLLAFSTSSSAAAMPLSLRIAQEKLNVRPSLAQFIVPVGATINMAGTALYQAVATIFLAQVFNVELNLTSLLIIIGITVVSSIGAPSIPGVGIVILATILETVGIPGAGIALILGVDRILDMCRTTVNITGDLTACVYFNKKFEKMFMKKNKFT